MNALAEFLNALLDIEITYAYSVLRESKEKREDILKKLHGLQSLRVKLNCFEGTGEVISESSDSETETDSSDKVSEETESSSKESSETSSSDSLNPIPTPPPKTTEKVLPPFPMTMTSKPAKKIDTESSDSDDSSSGDFGKYRKTPFVVLRPVLEKKEKGLYFKFWRLWDRIMKLKPPIKNTLKMAMSQAYECVFSQFNAKSETIKDFKRNVEEAYNLFREIYDQMEDDYDDSDFKKNLQQQRKAFTKLRDEVNKL